VNNHCPPFVNLYTTKDGYSDPVWTAIGYTFFSCGNALPTVRRLGIMHARMDRQ
jgi:hypothetical protein